jgi:hypothetical protein
MKMKSHEALDIYYDEQGDFLEISFGAPPESEYTEDLDSGIFVTKDRKTNEIKGIGILNFKSQSRELVLKRILKQLNLSLSLDISIPGN